MKLSSTCSFIKIAFILFIFFSCGLKTTKEIDETTAIAAVDFERDERELSQKQVQLVAGGGSSTDFGPAVEGFEENGSQVSQPVIALALGPGLYKAFLHINVLKALEIHSITPNVLTGSGLGAVIASLYAFSLTPDLIEWRVFNFLSQVRGEKVHSEKWIEKIDEILLKDYMDVNIEDADKVLRLAVFNVSTGRVEMKLRGSLRELVRAQFISNPKGQEIYAAPYFRSIFHQDDLKEGGVDFTIAIDALGPSFKLKNKDDYWAGVWGRTVGLSSRERSSIEAVLTLPSRGLAVDDGESVSKYLEKSLNSITDSVGRLKSVIDKWEAPSTRTIKETGWYEFDQDFFIGENED